MEATIRKTVIIQMTAEEADNIYGLISGISSKNEVVEGMREEFVKQLGVQLRR